MKSVKLRKNQQKRIEKYNFYAVCANFLKPLTKPIVNSHKLFFVSFLTIYVKRNQLLVFYRNHRFRTYGTSL